MLDCLLILCSAAQKDTTAKFSLITDGVHYPRKKPWLLVLPTAFPSTYS